MALYRMAGLYVEMSPKYEHLKRYAEKYLCEEGCVVSGDAEVIKVGLPDSFIAERQRIDPHLSLEECEYIWFGFAFACKLIEKNGFVLHSSAVMYEDNAYLFSADSGTGKSTHTSFWRDVFGKDKTVIINDDKPAIRLIDGRFCACGTPFSGKSDTSANVVYPIKALCFIYRSNKNEIRRMAPSEVLNYMFDQTLRPKKEELLAHLLEVLDGFLSNVPVYRLGVMYSPESARFAYEAINKA